MGWMMDIKQFDIYWVNLDPTIGTEIRKTRPGIVVSPDVMNKTISTIIIVPVTKTIIDWPFRTTIKATGQRSSAACDHIRSVSKKRLVSKIGSLYSEERQAVLRILQEMFAYK